MIILSGVLVVIAIALLVTGIVIGNTGSEVVGLDGLTLIYVSIAVSIVSALCLAIGVFLRRQELFGEGIMAQSSPATKPVRSATRPGKRLRRGSDLANKDEMDELAVTVTTPVGLVEVPPDSSVFVVPGRKRYHLDSCRQLAGREKEELTYEEAQSEGFSACTACMPDTALAARAAEATEAESAAAPDERLRPHESDVTGQPVSASDDSGEITGEGAVTTDRELTDRLQYDDDLTARLRRHDELTARLRAHDEPVGDPAADYAAADAAEPASESGPGDHGTTSTAATVPVARGAAAPPVGGASASGSDDADAAIVRILSGTKRYHRPDCALIGDIGDGADDLQQVSRREAKAKGCTPCLVCQPDREPAARD